MYIIRAHEIIKYITFVGYRGRFWPKKNLIKKVEKNRKNLLPNPYTGANIIEPLKRAQNT